MGDKSRSWVMGYGLWEKRKAKSGDKSGLWVIEAGNRLWVMGYGKNEKQRAGIKAGDGARARRGDAGMGDKSWSWVMGYGKNEKQRTGNG